jgi:hypothetical protein
MHAWIPISAFLIGTAVLAQNPAPPGPRFRSVTMVLPVPGAPLSVEIVAEHTVMFADGTSRTIVIPSKVFRDAAGRMRTEIDNGGHVIIQNHEDGFLAVLVTKQKTASRVQFPNQTPTPPFGFSTADLLTRVPGKKSFKSESIGKQTIEGIEFEGERTTTTSEEQPSLVGVEERWMDLELGLLGLIKSSGPDEQMTAKISNLDRHPPDPDLFKIPPDYSIDDSPKEVRDK